LSAKNVASTRHATRLARMHSARQDFLHQTRSQMLTSAIIIYCNFVYISCSEMYVLHAVAYVVAY